VYGGGLISWGRLTGCSLGDFSSSFIMSCTFTLIFLFFPLKVSLDFELESLSP
jgi:hypothetical protein